MAVHVHVAEFGLDYVGNKGVLEAAVSFEMLDGARWVHLLKDVVQAGEEVCVPSSFAVDVLELVGIKARVAAPKRPSGREGLFHLAKTRTWIIDPINLVNGSRTHLSRPVFVAKKGPMSDLFPVLELQPTSPTNEEVQLLCRGTPWGQACPVTQKRALLRLVHGALNQLHPSRS